MYGYYSHDYLLTPTQRLRDRAIRFRESFYEKYTGNLTYDWVMIARKSNYSESRDRSIFRQIKNEVAKYDKNMVTIEKYTDEDGDWIEYIFVKAYENPSCVQETSEGIKVIKFLKIAEALTY